MVARIAFRNQSNISTRNFMTTLEPTTNERSSATRHLTEPFNFNPVETQPLTDAVRAATSAVDDSRLCPAAIPGTRQSFRPRMLLALLTYCYARQTYGSSEIVRQMRHDVNLLQFSALDFPDAPAIRTFRRENRHVLQLCLTVTLRFLADQKVTSGLISHVSGEQIAEEARRRIIMAMFTDSLDSDEDVIPEAPIGLPYSFANPGARAH